MTVPHDHPPSSTLALVAELRAKPGREEELRALTLALVAPARREPSTLHFSLHEDREDPGHLVLYEIYASPADHAAHVAQAHVQAWFGRLPEITEGGARVVHLTILDPR